jgi:ABC-type transport system involved in cytochrome c biogenesis permease subunit
VNSFAPLSAPGVARHLGTGTTPSANGAAAATDVPTFQSLTSLSLILIPSRSSRSAHVRAVTFCQVPVPSQTPGLGPA